MHGKNSEAATGSIRESLPIDKLIPFANHPFKLYEGQRFNEMVQSIKEMGVIMPVVVRPLDTNRGTYEILSGHNRVNAAKVVGLTEVPVIIKTDLTDEEACLIVTETNLVQRSFTDLAHSERAIALRHHMDAIKSQGKRTDLIDEVEMLTSLHGIRESGTSYPVGQKLTSRGKTAESYGIGRTNVARYVRLTYLSQELLHRVDIEEIPFRAAVSLSYLTPKEQAMLEKMLSISSQFKVNIKVAEALRKLSTENKLDKDSMGKVLGDNGKVAAKINAKIRPKPNEPVRVSAEIYRKFFDERARFSEITGTIRLALEEYFEKRRTQEA